VKLVKNSDFINTTVNPFDVAFEHKINLLNMPLDVSNIYVLFLLQHEIRALAYGEI